MTIRSIAISNLLEKSPMKSAVIFLLIALPCAVQATPAGFGTFTRDATATSGIVSGRYTTLSGAKGSYVITRAASSVGYNGERFQVGDNGIQIQNNERFGAVSDGNDKFSYTFAITPDDNKSIHTIKIGQASYAMGGNSEIARQTLRYTPNSNISGIPTQATIRNNPSVPYFYNAMGDYFMGSRDDKDNRRLNSQNSVSDPQLRTDSSNASGSGLYYYNIPSLTGTSGNSNPYRPSLNSRNEVSLGSSNGVLPPTPTFENILKSTSTNPNNKTTYEALNQNKVINNGGTYVSYGIENSASNYVVAVKNAETVTLTYEGIMNGNIGVAGLVIGETYNEWISFGVESEPRDIIYYFFDGTVFNDNGGITQADANNAVIDSDVYNNSNYFNGKYDRVGANNESGISGSTVKIIDCDNPSTEYATQVLYPGSSSLGFYQIKVDTERLVNKDKVCIVEDYTGINFSIRTTSNKIEVTLLLGSLFYQNKNFGRVIKENAALVLEKEQAVNDCNITSSFTALNSTLSYSKNALENIDAGQCIAYKITATNRSNLGISKFIMEDILQKVGRDGATVTSKLADPVDHTSDYASNSVAIGNNGTVITNSFDLNQRSKRSFYFNTKYGTTQDSAITTP